MTHIDAQARAAALAALQGMAGITTASGLRLTEWDDAILPSVSAWTPDERLELYDKGDSTAGPTIKRRMRMYVEVIWSVLDIADAENESSAWKTKVEAAMATDFGGLVKYLMPVVAVTDFATPEDDEDGIYWYGRVTYEFELHVYTTEGNPEVAI